jgi:hypothetical protein
MRITSLERELHRAAVEHPTVAPLSSESSSPSQAPPLPASV